MCSALSDVIFMRPWKVWTDLGSRHPCQRLHLRANHIAPPPPHDRPPHGRFQPPCNCGAPSNNPASIATPPSAILPIAPPVGVSRRLPPPGFSGQLSVGAGRRGLARAGAHAINAAAAAAIVVRGAATRIILALFQHRPSAPIVTSPRIPTRVSLRKHTRLKREIAM